MAQVIRIKRQPAYIIRRNAYTESSWILDIFCRDLGRQVVLVKGARRIKSPNRAYCMPFQPVHISFSGRGEMMTVTALEPIGRSFELKGQALLCAYYLNELILRLLQRADPYPEVFTEYENTLASLSNPLSNNMSNILRQFEISLLRGMGVAPEFSIDSDGAPIDPDLLYGILSDFQVVKLKNQDSKTSTGFQGRSLLALHDGDFEGLSQIDMRRLLRLLVGLPLNRPLLSRKVMRQMVRQGENTYG